MLFLARPLCVGELPRSNRQTTAWPASALAPREIKVNAGPRIVNLNPGGPKPVEQHRNHPSPRQLVRTHAPRDKENQPEMPERKHAGAPDAVLARPLSFGELPRSNGQTTAWQQRPRARVRREIRLTAGSPRCCLGATLSLPSYPVATGRPRPGQQRPRARVRPRDKVNAGFFLILLNLRGRVTSGNRCQNL